MLYVTTRSNRDAYTPQRILGEGRGNDGGLYIPMHMPAFSPEQIETFGDMHFSQCVAELLNLQFNTKLTPWDVDLAVGRYPVRLKKLSQRIVIGELWHNTQWIFMGMVKQLAEQICKAPVSDIMGDWTQIGVRIAVIFGIYGELKRAGLADAARPFDVSVVSGDFSGAMSAWYARKWGLPIGNIICACNENSDIWNLFSHGQLRTDGVAKKTVTPDADVMLPESLERLVCAVGGFPEVEKYLYCVRRGLTYYVDDAILQELRRGIYITVISQPRIQNTIPNVYGTSGYVLSPYDALAYAGLMDYRSRTGESRCALILSEKSPECDLNYVADALKVATLELKAYFDRQ